MFSSVSAAVTHEHLKERALFSLPPPPPGANPAEYYLMASQRSPYGDLLMQSGAAAHLPDYISPVDGEECCCLTTFPSPISVCTYGSQQADLKGQASETDNCP